MRVLVDGVIYQAQSSGGISRYFSDLLSHLPAAAPEVEVLLHLPAECRSFPPSTARLRLVRDWSLRPRRLFDPLSRAWTRRAERRWKPDVFHSTYYTPPPWPDLPSVVTVHDLIHDRYPALVFDRGFAEQRRRVIESAARIIAVSDATRRELLEWTNVSDDRIRVIHHAPNETFRQPTSEAQQEAFLAAHRLKRPFWIYVGKRGGYKNFSTLLRALPRLCREVDGRLLLIGGEPWLDEWQMMYLIEHGVEERVRMPGALDDETLRAAYAASAGLVMPSLAEGFGIPLIEAMAAGAPVICSDIPVFHEVAGDAALYFDPREPDAIADAMLRSLDAAARAEKIESGRRRVQQFSWERIAADTAEVYREAAGA